MAEQTETKEGLSITVGIDTDHENRILARDFLLDPPSTSLWLRLLNVSDTPLVFRLHHNATACFFIRDSKKRRLWTYPGHVARKKWNLSLAPDEVHEKKIDAPWERVFLKPDEEYLLAGWLSGHPHLSTTVRFHLRIED
jgi:hypothetical protein